MSEEEFYFEDEDAVDDNDEGTMEVYDDGTQSGSAVFGGLSQPAFNKVKEETMNHEQLRAKVEKSVQDIMSVLAWKYASSLLLLRHFKWNPVVLKEKFFEDSDYVVNSSRIDNQPDEFVASVEAAECSMCWDDFEAGNCFSLACRHQICKECWRNHLLFHLKNSGASSIAVRCPTGGCKQFCGELAFSSIFGKESEAVARYSRYLLDVYSEEHEFIRSCPTPACESFIFHPMANKMSCGYHPVKCESCANKFCFGCGRDDHGPATCKQMTDWSKKEQDESETANWVTANTKPCPGCRKLIEKNGGCNHIVCAQCKYEWCWICEGEWSKHGSSWYKCNFFNEDEVKKTHRDHARTELERYIHYYTRYRVHEQSKKLDRLVLRRSRDRMAKALQRDSTASLVDLDYLETTAQVLIACRHTLMFSYVFAFYLEKGREKELFEFNQQQLEFNTELLSEFIEDRSGAYGKQEIVNRTSSAQIMLRKLQEGTNMPT